jgi:hypothetical protein
MTLSVSLKYILGYWVECCFFSLDLCCVLGVETSSQVENLIGKYGVRPSLSPQL